MDFGATMHEAAWWDLATVHYGISLLLGTLIGYIMKVIIDGLISHAQTRRAEAVEEFEDMLEEMAWQRAAEYAAPVKYDRGRKSRKTVALAA